MKEVRIPLEMEIKHCAMKYILTYFLGRRQREYYIAGFNCVILSLT